MKTKVNRGVMHLEIPTTDEGVTKEYTFPAKTAYKWYPFNINYSYKYSVAKEIVYLAKDTQYKGENFYKSETLKNSQTLDMRGDSPFLLNVYKRNLKIMNKAHALGLPIMKSKYNLKDVEKGFVLLGDLVDDIRKSLEDRLEEDYNEFLSRTTILENVDKELYNVLNEEERKCLQEYGEMFTMLNVMRKIAKDKERG